MKTLLDVLTESHVTEPERLIGSYSFFRAIKGEDLAALTADELRTIVVQFGIIISKWLDRLDANPQNPALNYEIDALCQARDAVYEIYRPVRDTDVEEPEDQSNSFSRSQSF